MPLIFSGNIFGQNLEVFAETIKRGGTEQKRDALLQIRNLETAEASRIAVPALSDSSEIVRATAAFSVVFLPENEAWQTLVPLLADKKPLVRREAAYALGLVGDPNAVGFLRQLFGKDKVLEVKNAALVALGQIGDASAASDLIEVLQRKPNKKEEFQRRSAARSIGQIAQKIQAGKIATLTPENFLPEQFKNIETPQYENLTAEFPIFRSATAILIAALQNDNEAADVKREAAFALGAIGDEAAKAILTANLTAEDYYLAEICRESLSKLNR